MVQIVFQATTTAGATSTLGATTSHWLDIPEWAPDIDYTPTSTLADNPDWPQFLEPTVHATMTTIIAFATGIVAYSARKFVLDHLAVAKNDMMTLCYREVGALVRT